MKNGRDLDLPLPEELRLAYDEYWVQWRPVLAGDSTSTRLWVTRGRQKLSAEAIRNRLQQLTESRLHVRMSLHDFRDVAATTAMIILPERPAVASAILGHVSPKSLRTYLQIAVALSATRRMARFLDELRRDFAERGSTAVRRDAPLTHDKRARTTFIQLAWLCVRYQPGSALDRWFRHRIGTLAGRTRRNDR